MAVYAPQPMQPSPVEVQGWQTGQRNARQQYEAQIAQNQYGRAQANTGFATTQRQLNYNQAQGRRTFDDPYIGRGIFNSGIRGAGLQNFYTNAANEMGNAQQAYLNQLGQYGLSDQLAQQTYTTTMQNLIEQENARRAQLALAIKDIT